MSNTISGKKIVITGGAGGLGYAYAERLGKGGAILFIADNNAELGRTAEGNVVTRALERSVTGFKSLPGIVVRAIVATLLGTGDLVSDLYTTVNLFSLSHLGPAYAMVAMICASMAVQVRATCARRVSLRAVSTRLWPHLWLRRRYWPSS